MSHTQTMTATTTAANRVSKFAEPRASKHTMPRLESSLYADSMRWAQNLRPQLGTVGLKDVVIVRDPSNGHILLEVKDLTTSRMEANDFGRSILVELWLSEGPAMAKLMLSDIGEASNMATTAFASFAINVTGMVLSHSAGKMHLAIWETQARKLLATRMPRADAAVVDLERGDVAAMLDELGMAPKPPSLAYARMLAGNTCYVKPLPLE